MITCLFIICFFSLISTSRIGATSETESKPKGKTPEKLFNAELKKCFVNALNMNHGLFKNVAAQSSTEKERDTQEENSLFRYIKRSLEAFLLDHVCSSNDHRRFWQKFTVSFFNKENKTVEELLDVMGFSRERISKRRILSKLNIADILKNVIFGLFNETERESLNLKTICNIPSDPYRFLYFTAYIAILSILHDFNTNPILKKRFNEVNGRRISDLLEEPPKFEPKIHNLRKRTRRGIDTSYKETRPNRKRSCNNTIKEFNEPVRQKKIVRKGPPVHSPSEDKVDNKIAANKNASEQSKGENWNASTVIEAGKNCVEFEFYKEFFEGAEYLFDEDLYYENLEPFCPPQMNNCCIELFDNINFKNPCESQY